ncbi:MAG TPA: arylamine N-acetyltransferase [Pseudolabrys sp.]|nr:arylamine N-acetyltransferase [Pseudolabrys sp.]
MTIDFDAYFKRIGYSGDRKPTLATLRELHRLQPAAIAFENLTPLMGDPVPLDAPSLHAKMAAGGRGGYCFEQNLLLASVLGALGFKCRYITGWPRWGVMGTPRPRTHLLLLITIDGEDWLAYVGFGGNTLTAPLALNVEGEQKTPHEAARIVHENGGYIIQVHAGEWRDLVSFDLGHQDFAELDMGNWYTSTHPKSRFRNELLAARAAPDARYGLANGNLSIRPRNGEAERRQLKAVSEIRDALGDLFQIRMPNDQRLDGALARVLDKP